MKLTILAVAAVAVISAPLAAQEMDMDMGSKMAAGHIDPTTSIERLNSQTMGWIIKTAEMASQADYDFRPTPEVRTLGQILGHVAGSNYSFCSVARDEKSPVTTNFEKATRAEIIAGLKAAAEYCSATSKWAAAHHHDARTLFGQKGDVTWVMAFNMSHNSEHYGNLVTYLRLRGKVPPSSQQG